MSKAAVNERETNTNSVVCSNLIIDELIDSLIQEAVRHFETSRPRSYEDDARYFYKKSELDSFWKLFKGDPNTLKCNTILDDSGDFFCYEICRIERKHRI